MNNKTWKIFVGIVLAGITAIAIAAGYDRLQPNVYIGQGTSITETVTFDTSHSPNAQISSDSSANMTLNGNTVVVTPAFSLSSTLSATHGGSLGDTFSGSPTFSGDPIFSGGANFSSGATVSAGGLVVTGGETISSGGLSVTGATTLNSGETISSGGLSVTGATTLNTQGGNTPFNCTIRAASTASVENLFKVCNSGEIVVGGGCLLTPTVGGENLTASFPTGTSTWNCYASGYTTITVYSMCCSI